MIAALILALLPVQPVPAESMAPVEVRFVAYDAYGRPLYMRPAWIFVGDPEPLGDRPLPPPMNIQDVDFSLRVTSVPVGETCAFPQTGTVEIARLVHFGCQP